MKKIILILAVFTSASCTKKECVMPENTAKQLHNTSWAKSTDTLNFYNDSVLVTYYGIKAKYNYYTFLDTIVVGGDRYKYSILNDSLSFVTKSGTSLFIQFQK